MFWWNFWFARMLMILDMWKGRAMNGIYTNGVGVVDFTKSLGPSHIVLFIMFAYRLGKLTPAADL